MKALKVRLLLSARAPLLALAALLVTFVRTQAAAAMPTFPAEIQTHLGLSFTPPCTLCHATPAGGGAVVSKFGQSMLAAGLTTDTAALDHALDTLASNGTDSNHDGLPDIEQLKDGSDPSTGQSFSGTPQEKFGCGARIAPGAVHADSAFALTALALGLVLAHRRRARKR